jgi:MOSC domain-containing protein YiiM
VNQTADKQNGTVVAVCRSDGGIPKLPQDAVQVTESGIVGDGHNHNKHHKSERALSLLDAEILCQLKEEGYDLVPGSTGENILFRNVCVQQMQPGTMLQLGEVIIRLEQLRKPCYVLDAIDPQLKEAIVDRCGYLASVVRPGNIRPGDPVTKPGKHLTTVTY